MGVIVDVYKSGKYYTTTALIENLIPFDNELGYGLGLKRIATGEFVLTTSKRDGTGYANVISDFMAFTYARKHNKNLFYEWDNYLANKFIRAEIRFPKI